MSGHGDSRPENGGGTVYELIHVFDMARVLNGESGPSVCDAEHG